jgi:hypothetical protein
MRWRRASDQRIVREGKNIAIKSRVAQDRRMLSRVPARLNCRFTYEGVSREAVIIDLSLNGAYLASKFLPPTDSCVIITLKTPPSKNALTLEGKVIRGGSTISDHGSLSRFGIRFSHQSLELIGLLNSLASGR